MSQKVKRLQSWMLEMDGKYAIMSDARADKVVTETAEHFYQLAEKDTIERALKWMKDNLANYFGHSSVYAFESDFKKYMEESINRRSI